jgi:hypothetical protein
VREQYLRGIADTAVSKNILDFSRVEIVLIKSGKESLDWTVTDRVVEANDPYNPTGRSWEIAGVLLFDQHNKFHEAGSNTKMREKLWENVAKICQEIKLRD